MTANVNTPPPPPQDHAKRNRILIALGAFFLFAGLVLLLYWIFVGRFYVSTDDAYVHGNQVLLTPQVESGVVAIFADETDLVEQGQILVQLDETPFVLQVEERKAALAKTVRDVAALFETAMAKKAEIDLRDAELFQAKLDLDNRQGLSEEGAISLEEYEKTETALEVAEAALHVAQKTYEASYKLIENTTIATHPWVEEAKASLRDAYLSLIRCRIEAPVTGFVAKRGVQVGEEVKVGKPLLTIVPLNQIWLEANFKETKLKHVRRGQKVTYTVDLYGHWQEFHGYVIGFSSGTGAAFALLPPENAAGNWIKIVQRVPIRIGIDPEEIKKYPLLLGLSLDVTINLHDQDGTILAPCPTEYPIYTTSIYAGQQQKLEEFERCLNAIVESNSG